MNHTHTGKSVYAALLISPLAGALSACPNGSPSEPPSLVSITVSAPPAKTVYVKGEDLDISGLVVAGAYSDGTTKTETVSLSNISGYNADTLGAQTLTVSIGGTTATFTVTVNAGSGGAVLQSIAVTIPPAKTVYVKGEDLDISGLVVAGAYSDGTTKTETVSLSNISGYDADTLGAQTLTVSIGGTTATFTVSVRTTVGVTVNLEDPVNGVPDDIALSKTGAPNSATLEISGAYATYAWRLNDAETAVSTTNTYTLNAADCPLGKNFLTVEVTTSGGTYYSREITFIVAK